jgi:O-antigen/teichoic acid export membrane protein
MSGTAIAQAITVAVSPLLTRLFAPQAFGTLGVYLSLLAITGAAATLRFDQALMLPQEDDEAARLFWNAMLSVAAFSGLALLAFLLFRDTLRQALKMGEGSGALGLLPLSLLFFGSFLTLNSWSARRKQFGRSSLAQMLRSLAAAALQLLAGIFHAGAAGLIGAAAAGDGLAALVLGRWVRRSDGALLRRALAWERLRLAVKKYRDFPLFSTPQNLLNAVSQNIPLLLLAKFFGPVVAGHYVLGVRCIQVPMNFVLTSLRQVFFQKASETCNRGGDVYGLFRKATLGLLALVTLPAAAVVAFGPDIFAFVLGRQWAASGEYARWLVLWLALMFANVPAVLFAQIYRKQRVVLLQDVLLLALRVAALVIGGRRGSALLAVALYSLVGVAFNLFIIFWAAGFLRRSKGAQPWAS